MKTLTLAYDIVEMVKGKTAIAAMDVINVAIEIEDAGDSISEEIPSIVVRLFTLSFPDMASRLPAGFPVDLMQQALPLVGKIGNGKYPVDARPFVISNTHQVHPRYSSPEERAHNSRPALALKTSEKVFHFCYQ